MSNEIEAMLVHDVTYGYLDGTECTVKAGSVIKVEIVLSEGTQLCSTMDGESYYEEPGTMHGCKDGVWFCLNSADVRLFC